MRGKLFLVAGLAASFLLGTDTFAAPVVGLVNNSGTPQLINFDSATPGTTSSPVTVTGLGSGQTLVGIDRRPIDDVLVGLGYNSTTGAMNVYSINQSTGAATSINANSLTTSTGLSRVMADFNPTANAFRITTSGATGNNLRIPTGGTGALTTDTDLNPANGNIRSSAYSRDNAGGGTSGATTLYLIDGTNNALAHQGSIDFFTGSGTSPNTGTLTTVSILLALPASSVVGFDIYNAPGTAAASPGSAYLATSTAFYDLNLSVSSASLVGTIGGGLPVVDIAVLPEPTGLSILGLVGMGLARRNRNRCKA